MKSIFVSEEAKKEKIGIGNLIVAHIMMQKIN